MVSSSLNSVMISFCMVLFLLMLFFLVFVGVRNVVVECCVFCRCG